MRVAFDVRPLQVGGDRWSPAASARRLLERLAPRLGDVILLAWSDEPRPALELPFSPRWYEVPRPRIRVGGWLQDRAGAEAFRRLEDAADLVHFPSPLELEYGWPTHRSRCKRVVGVRDLAVVTHGHLILTGARSLTRPAYARMADDLARADLVLCGSEFVAGQLRESFDGAHPPLVPVPPATDLRPPSPEEVEAYRSRAGLPARFLLFAGDPNPERNLDGLLEALVDAIPIPHVVVAGRDPEGRVARLRREYRQVPVTHLEYVSEEDAPGLYAAATAFVRPPLAEGEGSAAVEALACGAPVLAARAGCLPEVVGEAGRFFGPENPADLRRVVRLVLADEEARREMRAAGRERAAGYSWEAAVDRVLQAYEQVLGERRRAPGGLTPPDYAPSPGLVEEPPGEVVPEEVPEPEETPPPPEVEDEPSPREATEEETPEVDTR